VVVVVVGGTVVVVDVEVVDGIDVLRTGGADDRAPGPELHPASPTANAPSPSHAIESRTIPFLF
jgi:hypothetical protein